MQLGGSVRDDSLSPNCEQSLSQSLSLYAQLFMRTTPSVQTAGAGAAASVDLACAVTRALIFNVEPTEG